MTSSNNKVDTDSAGAQAQGVGCGALVRRARLKLPPQWEKCRTGIKGVRKWRCLWTQCWVTERDDDGVFLHVGVRGRPIKIERRHNTVQQALDRVHAASRVYREVVINGNPSPETKAALCEAVRLLTPNDKAEP